MLKISMKQFFVMLCDEINQNTKYLMDDTENYNICSCDVRDNLHNMLSIYSHVIECICDENDINIKSDKYDVLINNDDIPLYGEIIIIENTDDKIHKYIHFIHCDLWNKISVNFWDDNMIK